MFAIDLYTEGADVVVGISGLNGAKNLETMYSKVVTECDWVRSAGFVDKDMKKLIALIWIIERFLGAKIKNMKETEVLS